MDDLSKFELQHYPRIDRTLFGLTVLVVEDSQFACEAIHLQVYRPSVVIVDIGLPDGDAAELIEEVHAASPRVPVVLATNGYSFGKAVVLAAGADGFCQTFKKSVGVSENHSVFDANRLFCAKRRPYGQWRHRQARPDRVSRRYGAYRRGAQKR